MRDSCGKKKYIFILEKNADIKQRSVIPVNECFDRNSVSLDVLSVFNTFLIDDFSRLFDDVFTQKDFVIVIFSIPNKPFPLEQLCCLENTEKFS